MEDDTPAAVHRRFVDEVVVGKRVAPNSAPGSSVRTGKGLPDGWVRYSCCYAPQLMSERFVFGPQR